MGSIIEINDTLQLTREQGFPVELDLEQHLQKPFTAKMFKGKIFEFRNKQGIRNYQTPPVRNFLVENKDGKWIYWGLVEVVETRHFEAVTSGKFKITHIYSPDEMKIAHNIIDRNANTKYEF
jgi:hypothetical protein